MNDLEPGITTSTDKLPLLSTDQNFKWFKHPYFIGMFDNEDKVFLFFKEEAEETSDYDDKVTTIT